ncbi:MAG: hypothetical protein IT210_20685 [Armatimonadetes bacterium]|nr:hypothetical protein [Armatimonadota bacterium]
MRIVEILFYGEKQVKLVVEMPEPGRYTTIESPHLSKLLFRAFPHMTRHRCHNDIRASFKREARATEIPHLFEHLTMELQAQARPGTNLKGETQWNWRIDPVGRFHVYLNYENELLALGAIRLAERIINALDSHQIERVDTSAEIEKLKTLADMGDTLTASFPLPEPLTPPVLIPKTRRSFLRRYSRRKQEGK